MPPANPTSKAAAEQRPSLSLTVQYAVREPRLPRWRLRRWATLVQSTVSVHRLGLTLRIVGLREARQLNAAYRGRDYATNVLTFAYESSPMSAHADIVLCIPVLAREAREQCKPFIDHAAHLTVHGILHALGHDHEQAAPRRRMEALEIALLAKLGIADPYGETKA